MKFSLHELPINFDQSISRVKLAERAGFDQCWIAENHLQNEDAYICLVLCAQNTSRIMLGIGVTNPIFRHPSVIASSFATIDRISGFRAKLGIGTGDTPVIQMQKKPATLSELEESVTSIRKFTGGEGEVIGHARIKLSYSRRSVPIYIGAEGPKTLRLAGRIGDGVIVGSGISDEMVGWARERIGVDQQMGTRNSGQLDIVYAAMMSIDEDPKKAADAIKGRLSNRAHHNFQYSLDTVPKQYRPEVERLMHEYDTMRLLDPAYNKSSRESNAALVTDYLLKRFAITGTVEDCIKRIENLERLGVRNIMLDFPVQSSDEMLRKFADKVMIHFLEK